MNTDGRLRTAKDVLGPEYERGELWDGVFVVREPSGGWSSAVEHRVSGLLFTCEPARREGWSFSSNQGYLVSKDPDRVLSPDVSYVSRERLPVPPARGFITGPPDFAVEVRSPTDSWVATIEKGGVWIGHGVRVVWCIDPQSQRVIVLRPGEEPEALGLGDVASARPALDLDADVSALFEGLV